jgi:carotenoid cleavage dioxygenase
MHDFAFTERNIVFFDQPAVFDLDRAAAGTFPYSWQPDNGARVGLLPRGGTDADVRWFDTEIGYSFHPMNAHEREDGTIVVILPLTASAFTDEYALDIDAGEGSGFQRWTIDPVAGVVEQETLDATPQDFCRIDERLLGSPNRYGYTMALGQPDLYGETRVFKHDFVAGTREEHDFGPGRHPGEVVFVVDPARAEHEDGGWLLGLVHDDAVERTSMVILDAQRIGEDPVASVHLPRRVPYGFHGNWVPA